MYFYCDCSLRRLKRSHSGSPREPSSHKRFSASVAQRRAFTQCCTVQRKASSPCRAMASFPVPGAFYQCTEDAGVFNEYVKHGVMAE